MERGLIPSSESGKPRLPVKLHRSDRLRVQAMGEGIEEWGSGGIGSKPLARGEVSARGLDPLKGGTLEEADRFLEAQAPSTGLNPPDEQSSCPTGRVFPQ